LALVGEPVVTNSLNTTWDNGNLDYYYTYYSDIDNIFSIYK
jgi:hypothetical protein